nr:hypothetical protein [Tanacetum cinerariifolium]
EDIRLIESLLYDNSSPRPPEEFVSKNSDAEIESFSPSPILIKDSDSRMEEIDLSFTPDDPMPPSYHFDIPSFSRPPAKPPDGNTRILNIKMMGDNSEQKVPIPGLTITRVSNQEKSPDLLSHRSLETFQPFTECPMMIHGKNIHVLDVSLFHFYPLINSRIDETDYYHENEIRLTKRLLYDNSSPRPPEEFVFENSNADIESFSPSPILVEDSDSFMEEIDLTFNLDDPMPPGIEEDDDDSEGILNIKMMGDNSEQKVSIPGLTITSVSNQEKSPNLLSHRGLENFQLSSKCPMMIHGKNIPILDVPLFHFYPLD